MLALVHDSVGYVSYDLELTCIAKFLPFLRKKATTFSKALEKASRVLLDDTPN